MIQFLKYKQFHILLAIATISIFYNIPERFFDKNIGKNDLCIMRQLFDIPCPGCGITRSIYFIMHFNLEKAKNINPSAIMLIPVVVIDCLRRIFPSSFLIMFSYCAQIIFLIILSINYILNFTT